MRAARFIFYLLAVIGMTPSCVSDFSPEPMKGPQNVSKTPDSGTASSDAAMADARTSAPQRDTGVDVEDEEPTETRDGGKEPVQTAGPCDLSGRWIATERPQSQAYGAQQVSQVWLYFEIAQRSDVLTITRSLMCGGWTRAAPGEIFTATVDDTAVWPGYQKFVHYDGRKGTSRDNGTGCDVSFEPDSLIRGMTPDYYKDTSRALPTLAQQENGATPGWADWDQDGKPGISQVISGSASGTIYTAIRFTTMTLSGSIAKNAQSFKLENYDWKQERVVLGTREPDPIGILSSPAERNPGAGLNFYEFARLAADQATGTDDEICDAIRTLAPILNPAANPR